ncbi:MAG: hypothetical protein KAS04_00360 [Candidatus Aenigmarchaeota archaeon]|nr:hypothetical protein [Candidatus Aenigmarchaeota archaeon]
MDQVTGQRFMAIFIGFIMLASIMGFAMMQTTPETPAPVEIASIYERALEPDEMINILRNNKAVIEYFHNEVCIECLEKETLYLNFVNSEEFNGMVVVAYGVYGNETNETIDWMIDLAGNQIDLTEITTDKELRELFCSNDVITVKPNICILQELE